MSGVAERTWLRLPPAVCKRAAIVRLPTLQAHDRKVAARVNMVRSQSDKIATAVIADDFGMQARLARLAGLTI
jgi:hypothetical protein